MLTTAGTLYFALIGIGFMMAEIALLQRISVFLGHGLCSQRRPVQPDSLDGPWQLGIRAHPDRQPPQAHRLVGARRPLSSCPARLASRNPVRLESEGVLVRAGIAVLVLAPAGFLMGSAFRRECSSFP